MQRIARVAIALLWIAAVAQLSAASEDGPKGKDANVEVVDVGASGQVAPVPVVETTAATVHNSSDETHELKEEGSRSRAAAATASETSIDSTVGESSEELATVGAKATTSSTGVEPKVADTADPQAGSSTNAHNKQPVRTQDSDPSSVKSGDHNSATTDAEDSIHQETKTGTEPEVVKLGRDRLVAAVTDVDDGHVETQDADVTRILLGSCSNEKRYPIVGWPALTRQGADMFAFLGDVVYADTPILPGIRIPASPADLQRSFDTLQAEPEWQELVASTPLVGVWDDHDYGENDGDETYKERETAMNLFLDFMEVPKDSPRRTRSGVFSSYTVGPPDSRVRVILVDNRFSRAPYTDPEGNMLGAEQWRWLRQLLLQRDAKVTIIGAGIQMLPNDKWIGEGWFRAPRAQRMLFELIAETKATGVILASGDVHLSEISRMHCDCIGYPLYELTTSGLTHAWGTGEGGLPPGLDSALLGLALAGNRRVPGTLIFNRNFGEVAVDWKERVVKLRGYTMDGRIQSEVSVGIDDLQATDQTSKDTCICTPGTSWPEVIARHVTLIFVAIVIASIPFAVLAGCCCPPGLKQITIRVVWALLGIFAFWVFFHRKPPLYE